MSDLPSLSNGALNTILRGGQVHKPVLQVLNMKKIQSEVGNAERYRLQMSDGEHYQPCMLATQMNYKIQNKEVDKYCVVEVERYLCNTIHERKIIIIISMRVLKSGPDVAGPIGKPQLLELVRVGDNTGPAVSGGHRDPPRGASPGGVGGMGRGGTGAFRGTANGGNHNQQSNSGYRGSGPGMQGGGASGPSMNGRGYRSAAPPQRPSFNSGPSQMTQDGTLSQRTILPISSLNPYQTKWTIRARVMTKPNIRTWSNSRGEGKVMNVDLVDESGEIRASAFNQVADKLFPMLEQGKVYYFTRGRLKPANKQFNTTNNDYEMSLNEESEIELCTDASMESSLPTIQYNFRPIAEIESIEPNTLIDVIGVCKSISDLTSIITKSTNRKVSKRDLQLVDRTSRIVSCTLWGAEAEGFEASNFPIVVIKGARVSDFGGRSLNTVMSSMIALDPDIPEAHQLRGWFDNVGKNEESSSITGLKGGGGMQTAYLNFAQVKELNIGHREKPDYFNVKATITFANSEKCLYMACPSADCNKKVTEGSGGGDYYCEKCNQSFPNFKYRMILSINTGDFSSNQWLTCFQDTGAEVLGVSAQELGEMKEQGTGAYEQVFQKANFREYMFKVRAKVDTFNDEQRLKSHCVAVNPVNYALETHRRIDDIKQMMAAH